VTIWPGRCYDVGIARRRPGRWQEDQTVDVSNVPAVIAPEGDEGCAVALLGATPLDRLEEAVRVLKQRRSSDEVRRALVERIARAPIAEFETLKHIYLKHCGDTSR
jgi:hypothetical protein